MAHARTRALAYARARTNDYVGWLGGGGRGVGGRGVGGRGREGVGQGYTYADS